MALANLEELQAAWDEWMIEKNAKGKLTQGAAWRRDNPGEWQKLQDYRAGGPKPTLATRTGRQMTNEVAAWLEAKQEAPQPPDPGEPPTGYYWREEFAVRPSTWWNYQSGNTQVQWGDPVATLVDNGSGGKALRIGGGGPGGQGIFGAMWNGGDIVHGMQGETWMSTRMRFNATFNGWWFEHHENFTRYTNNTIYSPAIGFNLDGDRKLHAQTTGGPIDPHLGGKPRGTQTKDTQTLEVDRWYTLVEHMILTPDHSKGVHESWIDGRQWFKHQRGTLLQAPDGTVDQLAFGLYAYPWNPTTTMHVDFDHLTQGPTKTSVGA